jgi:hypothetical protein
VVLSISHDMCIRLDVCVDFDVDVSFNSLLFFSLMATRIQYLIDEDEDEER